MKPILKIENIFNPTFGGTFFIGTLTGQKDLFRQSKWLLRGNKGYSEIISIQSEQMPAGQATGKRIFVSDTFFDKSHLSDDGNLELEFISYID